MNKRLLKRMFVYCLCISFLSSMTGFSAMAAETKGLPMGEMVSQGEVRLVTKNAQEKVTSSTFPIFPGSTIATEKGVATIRLSNNSQIGIHGNTTFSFDQNDRFALLKGNVEFYIPSSEMKIQAGNVSIAKSQVQQARNGSVSPSKDDVAFGSVSIQPNGSITVKSLQGKLSILNSNNTVLAALGPKEAVTISNTWEGNVQVAQAGAVETAAVGSGEFLGLSTWSWVGVGAAVTAAGVGVGVAAGGGGGGGGGGGAVCP